MLRSLAAIAALSGCGSSSEPRDSNEASAWVGRTRGSSVVLTRDRQIAVVASRSAGVVSVARLDRSAPVQARIGALAEVDMGRGSEPWAAVIGKDDDTAYVISRSRGTLRRLVGLHGRPQAAEEILVGSEPTAIALTPSGQRLLIANWGEGTISVVTTSDFVETGRIDLNGALAGTGVLGGAVEPRPALAHPRALALTDDGDEADGDETLYATEFFSQPLPVAGDPSDPGRFDRNRQGLVYAIPLDEPTAIGVLSVPPLEDTGFQDSNGHITSCFPNQLYAAATARDRLYVTSMCASPAGPTGPVQTPEGTLNPSNFSTLLHPTLHSLGFDGSVPQAHVLTKAFESKEGQLRGPLIPNDLVLLEGVQRSACMTGFGADGLFCLELDEGGTPLPAGRPFVDLGAEAYVHLPTGLELFEDGTALVASDSTPSLALADLASGLVPQIVGTADATRREPEQNSPEALGRRAFATGTGVWSYGGQALSSCESCHPDGLSDGLTWFFPRGPRRTISTAGTYWDEGSGDPSDFRRRVLLWTANVDEIHDLESVVRTISGGVGAALWTYPTNAPTNQLRILYDGAAPSSGAKTTTTRRNNLNGSLAALFAENSTCGTNSCDTSPVDDWNYIDAFLRSVRTPLPPTDSDDALLKAGRELFLQGGCAGCHAGAGWTLSRMFYQPSPEFNGALPYDRAQLTETELDGVLGALRLEDYAVPEPLRALNPPASSGSASLRSWNPGDDALASAYDPQAQVGDQINCVLRDVGTYPSQIDGPSTEGVRVESGSNGPAPEVAELRQDMKTPALGESGFNIPSLVGLGLGAPYLHAGNARTLEELFDERFAGHYQAAAPGFLAGNTPGRAQRVRELVTYLLSIRDESPTNPPSWTGPDGELLNPDLCSSRTGR